MAEADTPIEEWRTSKPNAKGTTYEYVVLKGVGGGVIRRQGSETPDEARLRHAVNQEGKRRAQAQPPKKERPKGKGRQPDRPPDIPKPNPDAGKHSEKPTQAQLAAAAQLPFEVLGAFVGLSLLGCPYCAAQMRASAPAAAADLAKTTNPYLQQLLQWWQKLMAGLLSAGGEGISMFVGVPLLHHAAPDPMYEFVAPIMGMPERPSRAARGHVHQHPAPARAETQPQPGVDVSGPPMPPPGFVMPMTPEQAAAIAAGRMPAPMQRSPTLAAQPSNGGQPAGPAPAQAPAPPAVAGPALDQSPEQMAAERAALMAEAARLQAAASIGAREQLRVAQMSQAAGNVPAYRAEDTLTPAQLRQIQAAEASRHASGGAIPNYTGGEHAAGTASAPGTDPAQSAGSPLPPEAEA